jgi:hypothetical protein
LGAGASVVELIRAERPDPPGRPLAIRAEIGEYRGHLEAGSTGMKE